ncbi:MAG: DUF2800 domain-containing protein [Lachnospiraceae bacterium]|nr:DUF2800 domain-containing protein [Lachnospiraceae bacterium]
MADHARLSPSASHRWINCPGSVHLAEQCPPQTGSAYTAEGTEAHALAELKLRKFNDEGTSTFFDKQLENARKEFEFYSGEMEEATDFYFDIVTEKLIQGGPDAELMIEQRFSLDKWVPESFGSADAVIIAGNTIEVCDLKYGKGVKVDAVGNPQLRLYGLGAAELFGNLYDFDTVRVTIIQPRLDHVSTEEISLKELRIWAEEEVAPRAEMAMNDSDFIQCGEWCRFCPAKAICRARAEANLELAKHDFKKPELLTDEEIGDILKQAEELEKWVADISGYALEQALAGKQYTGWKLVEGRSIRKYADEIKVADTLRAAGYDDAMLYERKLNGITNMEKLVGKKKLTELLGDLLVKPAGKPVLVPESDKREAINTTEAAKADFTE